MADDHSRLPSPSSSCLIRWVACASICSYFFNLSEAFSLTPSSCRPRNNNAFQPPACSSIVSPSPLSFVTATTTALQAAGSSSSASTEPMTTTTTTTKTERDDDNDLEAQKRQLFELLTTGSTGTDTNQPPEPPQVDSVLVDPLTLEPLTKTDYSRSSSSSSLGNSKNGGLLLMGGQPSSFFTNNNNAVTNYRYTSPSNVYTGSSRTYVNLLEPASSSEEVSASDYDNEASPLAQLPPLNNIILPLVPPFLRAQANQVWNQLSNNNNNDDSNNSQEYIPMRDLFTSPAVSAAYERGWRQGFRQAGFPGPDVEAQMAMDYFRPSMPNNSSNTIVDMSCATGLFTRRFSQSQQYSRVLGCDYSPSMLLEAQQRWRQEQQRDSNANTIEWIRLDVGQIPMANNSVPALHAGAAMHCWPDLPRAVSEIYRVLKPNGGRYFATTFLSSYFGTLRGLGSNSNNSDISTQAFQYFTSVDELRDLMVNSGGFSSDKVHIEVLGAACVVIRCEK